MIKLVKYAYDEATGEIFGFRGAQEGETEGNCTPRDLVWGMNKNKYKVIDDKFTSLTQLESDAVDAATYAETLLLKNSAAAKKIQDEYIADYTTSKVKRELGLVEEDETELILIKEYMQALEADINNPPSDEVYTPPLPPGVVAPDVGAISITMTRPEGWNSQLGWKMVFSISDPEYVPANIAISVYSAENCTGYLYTPGALQYDAEIQEYYAICPPGQEKGDVDYYFGLLYGAAQLACWTFAAGTQEEVKLIYGEEV